MIDRLTKATRDKIWDALYEAYKDDDARLDEALSVIKGVLVIDIPEGWEKCKPSEAEAWLLYDKLFRRFSTQPTNPLFKCGGVYLLASDLIFLGAVALTSIKEAAR